MAGVMRGRAVSQVIIAETRRLFARYRTDIPLESRSISIGPTKFTIPHEVGTVVRILIIDENADAASVLGLLLRNLGCSVETCVDPFQAAEVAQRFEPHLVLLDLAMPRFNGFEVAKALRSLDLPPFLLAAISGRGEPTIRDRCMAEGFDRFILKPATGDQIYDLLAFAMQRIVTRECAPQKASQSTRIDRDGHEASDNRGQSCNGGTSQDISRRTALSESGED